MTGELIISTDHVEFRAKKEKDSRSWAYGEIKLFEILSPTRVRVWTYQNRKLRLGQEENLTFKIINGQIDQQVSDFLRERITRPFVTSFTNEESEILAQIPLSTCIASVVAREYLRSMPIGWFMRQRMGTTRGVGAGRIFERWVVRTLIVSKC